MREEAWTWDAKAHPRAVAIIDSPTIGAEWCDRLETAAENAVIGKLWCVCVAESAARAALEADEHRHSRRRDAEALDLLVCWIDAPTEARFDGICTFLFNERGERESTLHEAVWWALRTAAASIGNLEVAWALASTFDAALRAGLTPEQLGATAIHALRSRRRQH